MKKIVLISPILQHYRISFYEKLAKANPDYELIVFHGVKKSEDGKPGYSGETSFKNVGFIQSKYKFLPFSIRHDKGMYKEFKKVNPDILIIQGITGNISYRLCNSWARRHNKIIIGWTCGFEPGVAKGAMLWLKNKLVSSFFKKADYFLTYSSNSSRYVESLGVKESIIETCYNGIETDDLEKNADEILKKSREIVRDYQLEGKTTFLYVGALIKEKKVDFLIDAFVELEKKYSDIKLIIIGDGPLKGYVQDAIEREHEKNILYFGRIYDGVDAYFAASDCFVLPGTGGLGLNQAMFWRKTCIVSPGADGTQDDLVIEGYSGYRFVENDMASLISAMEKRINESPVKLEQMAENSYKIIAEKSNVNNMVKLFKETIERFSNSKK